MQGAPLVVFIDYHAGEEKFRRELDGIRRFAKPRGWRVATLDSAKTDPATLPEMLKRVRPAGCIAECSARQRCLPPRLFGGVPVVYLDSQRRLAWRGAASVVCDNAAVAQMAFRELSTGVPRAYAAVGFRDSWQWSRDRVAAFRALCAGVGMLCLEFFRRAGESREARVARLERWVAALPPRCAVFAVNDIAAGEVARAFTAAHRAMPHTATLVGADAADSPEGFSGWPTVSSVRLDFELAGYLAAKMLAEMIRIARTTWTSGTSGAGEMQKGDSPVRPMPLFASFGPLLVERRKSTGGQGRREPFALKAVDTIRRKACDGLTAEKLASRFNGSRHLFEMRFREATGHSVGEEIIQVRLERAMDLLSRRDVPIADIARLCGFRSDIALRKLFRSRLHVSMRQWRSEHC